MTNYFTCTARPYLLPSIFSTVYDFLDYVFLSEDIYCGGTNYLELYKKICKNCYHAVLEGCEASTSSLYIHT